MFGTAPIRRAHTEETRPGRTLRPSTCLRLGRIFCRPSSHLLSQFEKKRGCCVPSRLPKAIRCVLPCPALPSKPRACDACVNLTQVCFDQAEGLLNEVMQLVDRGQGIDTDDGEELFEAPGKVGRRHLHLVDQSIQPAPARIVEAVEPQLDEQEVLLGGTEGIVEDQHLVALGQLFLLPGGTKRKCARTIATAKACG